MAGGIDSPNTLSNQISSWFRGDTRTETTPARTEPTRRSPVVATDGMETTTPARRFAAPGSNAAVASFSDTLSPANTARARPHHCSPAQWDRAAGKTMRDEKSDRHRFGAQGRMSADNLADMTAINSRATDATRAEGIVALARAGKLPMSSPRVQRAIAAMNERAGGAAPTSPGRLNAGAEARIRNVESRAAGWQGDVADATRANATFARANPEYADLLDDTDTDAGYDDDQLTSTAANDATKTEAKDDNVIDPSKLGASSLRLAQRRNDNEANATGNARKRADDAVVKQFVAQNIVDKRQAMTGSASEAIGAAVGALST